MFTDKQLAAARGWLVICRGSSPRYIDHYSNSAIETMIEQCFDGGRSGFVAFMNVIDAS